MIELSKIFYENEINPIVEDIRQKFGDIDGKLKRRGFPKETAFVPNFLYLATSSLNPIRFDWTKKELHKSYDIPELELELFFLELYTIIQLELPKLESEIQDKLPNYKFEEEELSQLFDKWKYEINISEYFGLQELLLEVTRYVELAKAHDLREFEKIITNLSSKISSKFKDIQNLQSRGRKLALEEIFSRLSKGFKVKINQEILEISSKPDKFNYRFFPLQVSDQVFSIFRENLRENIITLKLFNKDISKYVNDEIKSKLLEPNTITLDSKDNIITIHNYRETNFRGNPLLFHKYIDYFFSDLFDTIINQSDKLILRYSPESEHLLEEYFSTHFLIDTENAYFDLSFDQNSQNHFYFIKITRKEVK